MAGDARVEVMDGLELQAAVDEVQPGGAVHVHGCAEHFLREGFMHAQVGRRHGEVGQGDLDVERRGHHVRDQDEYDPVPDRGDAPVDGQIAEPVPEEDLAQDFEVTMPPCGAFVGAREEDQVRPG